MMSFTLKDVNGQDVGHDGVSIYWENRGVLFNVQRRLEYITKVIIA